MSVDQPARESALPNELVVGRPVRAEREKTVKEPENTGHRLVLEIEVPDFYVDGTEQEFADEHALTVFDIATEEWMRRDVGLTFVSIPGEKNMSGDFEVHAMNGLIVGARIVRTNG